MPTRATKRCAIPGCTNPAGKTGHCDRHAASHEAARRRLIPTKAARTPAVRRHRAAAVAEHRATYGNRCPGFEVPAHPATDLTADDPVPIARGGDPMQALEVLCRACNGRKADRLA